MGKLRNLGKSHKTADALDGVHGAKNRVDGIPVVSGFQIDYQIFNVVQMFRRFRHKRIQRLAVVNGDCQHLSGLWSGRRFLFLLRAFGFRSRRFVLRRLHLRKKGVDVLLLRFAAGGAVHLRQQAGEAAVFRFRPGAAHLRQQIVSRDGRRLRLFRGGGGVRMRRRCFGCGSFKQSRFNTEQFGFLFVGRALQNDGFQK